MTDQADHERLWGAAALATYRAVDAVVEVNSVGVVTAWNERAADLFGTLRDEATGDLTLGEVVPESHRFDLDTAVIAAHEGATAGVPGWRGLLDLVRCDGQRFRAEVTVIPASDEMAGSALLVVRPPVAAALDPLDDDLSAGVGAALHGLVSVERFTNLLDLAFAANRDRDPATTFAVLRVELDAGNGDERSSLAACQALCEVAGDDGVVAALTDRGFALLLDQPRAPFFAANVADRLARDFREGRAALGGPHPTTVSIGIAFGSEEGVDGPQAILDHADHAVARATDLGGDRWDIFDGAVRDEVTERRRFRDELYGAIDAGDFRVHYQPANDVAADRITMVEALVRWDHPTRGLVAANEFLDLAEETGLILPLGAWVLNEACRQLREWLDAFGDSAPIVTVNFSPTQLHHPAAPQLVAGVIEANALNPQRLCIEVAQAAALEDAEGSMARLNELRALGVRTSLDHFGVLPWSSLDDLPLDFIKIDRSVVAEIDASDVALAAAKAIVDAAHATGMSVAAEGVETEAQLDAVRSLGCDQIQGYFLARPQSGDDIGNLVSSELAAEPRS